jgi:hypothetical protein
MKKESRISVLVILSALILLSSCTSYLIPMTSFKEQFSGIDSTKLKLVNVIGPIRENYSYLANPIRIIKCEDKNGNPFELVNSPSIEIRFTHGDNNKRTVYYFDRVFVTDSCVIGVQSRFVSSIRKTIPLQTVTTIEVQDGKKNFHYNSN